MNAKQQLHQLFNQAKAIRTRANELGVNGVSSAIWQAGVVEILKRQDSRVKQYGENAFPMTTREVARIEEIFATEQEAINRAEAKLALAQEIASAEEIATNSDLEEITISFSDDGVTKTIYVTGKSELGNIKWHGQSASEFYDFMVKRAIAALPKDDNESMDNAFRMLPRLF